MSKIARGTYAFDNVLKQLRQLAPALVYDSRRTSQGIRVFNGFMIASNKTSFRPVGVLDWAHYTAAGIRDAIQHDFLQEYYEEMLEDSRSPANVWKDKRKEQSLKEQYAHR